MRVDCIVESINNIWRTAMEQGSQINAMCIATFIRIQLSYVTEKYFNGELYIINYTTIKF